MNASDPGRLTREDRAAERLGCDPREIVAWPWTTASPGLFVRTETVERIIAARVAAAKRETRERLAEALAGRVCWGDYVDADGKRRYGAGVTPESGVAPPVGLTEWIRSWPEPTGNSGGRE